MHECAKGNFESINKELKPTDHVVNPGLLFLMANRILVMMMMKIYGGNDVEDDK